MELSLREGAMNTFALILFPAWLIMVVLVIEAAIRFLRNLGKPSAGSFAPYVPLETGNMTKRTYRPHIRPARLSRKYLGLNHWICSGYGFSGAAETPKLAYDLWYQKFIGKLL